MFVKVQHDIRKAGDTTAALIEAHDIVYRPAPSPADAAPPPKMAPLNSVWQRRIVADDVLLFRYSALTFNGHRIHYDQPYVTGDEGYPGLIVHGPLLGMLQLELARRSESAKVPASFEFRALSPVFAGAPLTVGARREADGSIATWIANESGDLSQLGKVSLR